MEFAAAPRRRRASGEVAVDAPSIRVFTTRPDTIFGATYLVLAPEHPLVERDHDATSSARRCDAYRERGREAGPRRAQDDARRRPASSPAATPPIPATGEPIPIWIADYVLMEYGTGAIMAVPGHDERDFEFARKFACRSCGSSRAGAERRDVAARGGVHRERRRRAS